MAPFVDAVNEIAKITASTNSNTFNPKGRSCNLLNEHWAYECTHTLKRISIDRPCGYTVFVRR